MPWRVSTPMSERQQFVEDAQRGLYATAELCARYGVSRKTGYKWLARFEAEGLAGLADRSRRPHAMPQQLEAAVTALLLATRRAHPTWGPRTLLVYLVRRHARVRWPAAGTVGELLKREGLIVPRRRRRVLGHPGRPLTPMDQPTVVWTADFKGQFRTGDRRYCYPLTVIDGNSRYLLVCEALARPTHVASQPVFRELFRHYGLPERIRTDNGVPFATSALGRLSQLSVWWITLGITPELIEPAHQQQNGRHERLHRTLKAETTKPPAQTAPAQQRRFRSDASVPSSRSSTRSARTRHSRAMHQRAGTTAPAGTIRSSSRSRSTRATSRCAT